LSEIIFVAKERVKVEARVAASPETVRKYTALGYSVIVETGAGISSCMPDAAYEAAGAEIAGTDAARKADIILRVRRPIKHDAYKKGAIMLAIFDPHGAEDEIIALAKAKITGFSMEFMPRITRAQTMDVLSSQASLSGYQAVIDAAEVYNRVIPMMMTAAGTVPAAKIFVMGAGVAGLQAIATARRLGAVVTANDVRAAVKEQVVSLGAKFIAVEDEEFRTAETVAGYAKEMSKKYQEKQAALIAQHISRQDIVITTALIPGRPAPRLITRSMLETMQLGSVLVDLAVEQGGNVEGAVADRIIEVNGIKIVGYANVPGRIAATASQLYARNLYAFLEKMTDRKARRLAINFEDELVKATLIIHDGKIVHSALSSLCNSKEEAVSCKKQQAVTIEEMNHDGGF